MDATHRIAAGASPSQTPCMRSCSRRHAHSDHTCGSRALERHSRDAHMSEPRLCASAGLRSMLCQMPPAQGRRAPGCPCSPASCRRRIPTHHPRRHGRLLGPPKTWAMRPPAEAPAHLLSHLRSLARLPPWTSRPLPLLRPLWKLLALLRPVCLLSFPLLKPAGRSLPPVAVAAS
jgi:hypothetical protein